MSLPTKKRKLVSETDPERCLSIAKKRRICEEDMTKNHPSSKPLLKGKRGKAKKSKLVDKNVSQSLAPASEGQLSQTVIHPENETHDVPGAAKVWIIGSEHYITGAKQSTKECYGENFELNVTVSWIGKAKLRWRDVLSLFYMEMSRQRSAPDVLVLHAGTNDMGNTDVSELVNTMLKDLTHLHGAYPNMKIVYSWITPRSKWGKFKVDQINEDRKTVNKTIEQNAGLFNGVVIKHERLKPSAGFLFQENGIHFSNEGFEMFVCSIHDTIEQILNQASSREQSQPQSNDGTTSAPHKVQTTMPEKDEPSREHLNEMSPTVSPPAKKRKLESETD
ncbi:uncharacterized protein LOC112155316, partial [Oryzias melastigma]|uniref:uncharacterized protein LOC112155316 n=1 Tax=Oryzias melastigma TaxID=30732 RepID=UPI000CF828BC